MLGLFMDQMQETSMRILDAATKRFLHYGYQKTAMNEIAKDLNMSTGNLYRFFPSKLDIAEAIAAMHEEQELIAFEEIASASKPAEQRLRELFHRQLIYTSNQIAQNAKAYELVQTIMRERPEYGENRLKRERGILVKIYNDGVNQGEFTNNDDPEKLMTSLLWATSRFRFSYFHLLAPLETLQRELDGVLDLAFKGIIKR